MKKLAAQVDFGLFLNAVLSCLQVGSLTIGLFLLIQVKLKKEKEVQAKRIAGRNLPLLLEKLIKSNADQISLCWTAINKGQTFERNGIKNISGDGFNIIQSVSVFLFYV